MDTDDLFGFSGFLRFKANTLFAANLLHTLHKKKLPLISCCGNQGELMLYLCFLKRSRNHLRGFLIAA